MNSKNSTLLRIERALDRVERTLKMIDTRVGQLHAAANFSKNKSNSATRTKVSGGGYFGKSALFGRPSPAAAHRKTNYNFVKLKINK